MRNFITLSLAILLTACASTTEENVTSSAAAPVSASEVISKKAQENSTNQSDAKVETAEQERIVCSMEQTIGSNRKSRVCRKVSN